ncbi:MAG TPA: MarR family transcriptional regulator [Holophagaceae bacterium]
MDKAESIERIFQDLRRMVHALELYSKDVNTRFGLTAPQLWALWELERGGEMTLGSLAKALQLHPSTVVGVVDRLEGKDLAKRELDPSDRRRIRIRLMPKGRALLKRAPHPAQGRLVHGLQAMSESQVTSLRRAMTTLVRIMEAGDLEARFFFSED